MTLTAPAAVVGGASAVVPYRDLLAALATVGAVINRKADAPWNGALLAADPDGDLTITGASPAATVSVRLPGVAHSAGSFLVDGGALTRLCKALVQGESRRDTGDLAVLLDGSYSPAATVTIGDYTIPLTNLPREKHPGACQPAPTIATLDPAALRAALDRVLPALGRDDILSVLTGVHLSFGPGEATVAATDRYRLAVESLPATVTGPAETELLLPGRLLAACAETWTGQSVTVGRSRADSGHHADRATFTCGQTTVSLTETGGSFPPWRRLLAAQHTEHTASFDRATVQAHVGRVLAILAAHPAASGIAGRSGVRAVRPILTLTLTLTPDGLRVAPLLDEHASRVDTPTLPATTSITDGLVRWTFNAAYLRDALAALPGERATLHGRASDKPVILTADDLPSYQHLLMPIRID